MDKLIKANTRTLRSPLWTSLTGVHMDDPKHSYRFSLSRAYATWFKKLTKTSQETATIISKRLVLVKDGEFGDFKYLGDKVFELRFGISLRIYYSIRKGNTVVLLLVAGNKDEQKLDIKAAKKINKEIKDEDL